MGGKPMKWRNTREGRDNGIDHVLRHVKLDITEKGERIHFQCESCKRKWRSTIRVNRCPFCKAIQVVK